VPPHRKVQLQGAIAAIPAPALHGAHRGYSKWPLTDYAAMQHIKDRRRKGDYTMSFLAKLFPRPVTRAEAELAYLRASANLYDLEMREREISRGKFAAY
jgi:hypothetical protein